MNLSKFFLNTPKKYWLVVKGYHVHKSFFGLIIVLFGLFFIWLIPIGIFLMLIDMAGHHYTNYRPLLCFIKREYNQ